MEELKNDSSKRFKKLKTNPEGSMAFTMPMQLMDSVDLKLAVLLLHGQETPQEVHWIQRRA